MIDGERVRLRDVTPADADLLDSWDAAITGFNDFAMPRRPVDREFLETSPLRSETRGTLIVETIAERRPIGTVSWHLERYGPNPESGAWNIGIELIPDARGHGYGWEAQALLIRYLFESTDVHRIEAATDVENVAEQRSLEKAGMRRDGILRGAQYRAGSYHDLVIYARLRDDA